MFTLSPTLHKDLLSVPSQVTNPNPPKFSSLTFLQVRAMCAWEYYKNKKRMRGIAPWDRISQEKSQKMALSPTMSPQAVQCSMGKEPLTRGKIVGSLNEYVYYIQAGAWRADSSTVDTPRLTRAREKKKMSLELMQPPFFWGGNIPYIFLCSLDNVMISFSSKKTQMV